MRCKACNTQFNPSTRYVDGVAIEEDLCSTCIHKALNYSLGDADDWHRVKASTVEEEESDGNW